MDIGSDSFLDDRSAFFCQDRYFLMLYASEPDHSSLRQLARTISLKLPAASPPPKEIGFFPPQGLKPGSIRYFSEGLLGHQFLGRGFVGTYVERGEGEMRINETEKDGKEKEEQGGEVEAFLALFQDPYGAQRALLAYHHSLTRQGSVATKPPTGAGPRVLEGQDRYRGNLLAISKGRFLLGAVGFRSRDFAKGLLDELARRVR